MRKPDFCLCENKGADQLRSNCEADQRLCFRYSDSTILLLLIAKTFKPLACFCDCTGPFVTDLVGNPEDRFSCVAAQLTGNTNNQLGIISKEIPGEFKYFLNPKFPASCHVLCLYSLVCFVHVQKVCCWFSHGVAQIKMVFLISER